MRNYVTCNGHNFVASKPEHRNSPLQARQAEVHGQRAISHHEQAIVSLAYPFELQHNLFNSQVRGKTYL
jgi:hypothetical protein